MQAPKRKAKKTLKKGNLIRALALTGALLIAAVGLYFAKVKEALPFYVPETVLTSADIKQSAPEDIVSIAVTLRDEESYRLTQKEGKLWLDSAGVPIDDYMAADIFKCFAPLYAKETVLLNHADLAGRYDTFGLEPAVVELTVSYIGGETLTVKVGDEAPETGLRYLTVSGDSHLYLCASEMYSAFYFDYRLFFPVAQPGITTTRIDRFSVSTGAGDLLFAYSLADDFSFQSNVTDETVENSYYLTYPVNYPADSEWVKPLLTALQSFVLGPKMADDTPENRALYGLDNPEYILTVHEVGGITPQADAGGAISFDYAPEKTHTFYLGREHDGFTRYVLTNGSINLFNTFQLSFVYDLKPFETLLSKPFNIPLNLVAAFSDGADRYVLTRTETILDSGETQTEAAVTKNGAAYDYELFESRWQTLAKTTLSGRLPEGFSVTEAPVKTMTITLTTGETRTITLAPFDSLHNAVGVDGEYLFYLVKGGLTF